ncbi:hypothetical protein SDC9_111033 [bioreactor metagenome]|uniref:Uncharacterized protein n=1 Tax=bioreactor metagenome TaxID=1076179 RepID=A0A645BFN3_9ZZZZ
MRQPSLCTGNLVPHIVGSSFHIYLQVKLNVYGAGAIPAGTGDGSYTGYPVYSRLQRFSYLGLYDIGIGSREGAPYRNYRIVNTRVIPDT